MFTDRTLINRRNVTGDPSSSCRANRDFLAITFKSRVIAAAMKVLGIESRTSHPVKYPLPANMASMKKLEKLQCLHDLSAKVVDEFVFQPRSAVNTLVGEVLTEQEREILSQQDLTPDERFPCRFPGCERTMILLLSLMKMLLRWHHQSPAHLWKIPTLFDNARYSTV